MTKEITAAGDTFLTIKLKDTFNLEDISVSELERTEKMDTTKIEVDRVIEAQPEMKPEHTSKTEKALSEAVISPSKIPSPNFETQQTVETNVSSPILPTVLEEPVSNATDEKPVDVKLNSPTEIKESQEVEKAAGKNRRQAARRRRSTASESNETPKIMKIEVTENVEEEETDVKKIASTKETSFSVVKNFHSESVDSEV